jgi:hypothetical protein
MDHRTPATGASRDGRTFTFGAAGAAPLLPGDLVTLRATDGGLFLGQVLDEAGEAGSGEAATGGGLILGELG